MTLRSDPAGQQDLPDSLLVTVQATLDAVAGELDTALDLRRFRTNVHVELDAEAFAEEGWEGRGLRVGEAELELLHPCERCAIPTRDPDTQEKWAPLLRHLFDRHSGRFGINARALGPASIRSGSRVTLGLGCGPCPFAHCWSSSPSATACLAGAGPAAAKTTWLCLPGLKDNACTSSLTTTRYSPANQQPRIATPKADRRRSFDCFYVYPTVSDQKRLNATKAKDPELREIARFQAARLGQHCRVYAPVYRQLTLQGIAGAQPGQAGGRTDRLRRRGGGLEGIPPAPQPRPGRGAGRPLPGRGDAEPAGAQADRPQAFRAQEARGGLPAGRQRDGEAGKRPRGLVPQRARVPLGHPDRLRGGLLDLQPDATPGSLFGRTGGRFATVFGQGPGAGLEVLCTNPAALRGGAANLTTVLPSRPFSDVDHDRPGQPGGGRHRAHAAHHVRRVPRRLLGPLLLRRRRAHAAGGLSAAARRCPRPCRTPPGASTCWTATSRSATWPPSRPARPGHGPKQNR